HTEGVLPRYAQNLTAAVAGTRKVIVRREGIEFYDLSADPLETAPVGGTIDDFEAACRRDGLPATAVAAAVAHVQRSIAPSRRAPTRRFRSTRPVLHPTDQIPLAPLHARGSG